MCEKQEDSIKILREQAFTELLLQTVRFLSPISARCGRFSTMSDIVAVVRCKDCVHHRKLLERDMCAKNAVVLTGREVGLRATKADDFCSYGERKTC